MGDLISVDRHPLPANPDESVRALRSTARGGAVTFVGSAFSAAMGFALSITLARAYGASGSGVVLQAMAVFTIVLSFARLGMDTTAVWILPRVRADSAREARGALTALLGWCLAAGVLASVVLGVVAAQGMERSQTDSVLLAVLGVAPFLPFGALMMVALAATRGFGGTWPFNLIGNIAVPLARPVLVLTVAALGGSAILAAAAWAAVLLPAALVSLWYVLRQVGRFESRRQVQGSWRADRALQRRILGFALPRTLASGLEQAVIWLDVLLVGVIAGSAAAGVYGAAARFVSAGVIVATALRIVVAPRFSAGLARGDIPGVQTLYVTTARWILLFGSPIYVLLAWFSPTVLRWLGPDFAPGVTSLVVLCFGSLIVLSAGNIQSLLLMSGRSGWGAINKLIVVAVNVAGNLILIPVIGILGAAVTWAFSMALDTALAIVQVRRFTGVRPRLGPIAATLLVSASCASVPAIIMLGVRGNDSLALVVATACAGLLIAGYALLDRRRLSLDVLIGSRGRG